MRALPFRWWQTAVLPLALLLWSCGSTSVSVTAPTGSKCQVSASASSTSAPAAGANGTVSVTTNRDCTWTASSAAPWIAITSNATGQGEGTVAYRVSANTDPVSRRGQLSVNDAQITIAQDAAACTFTATPASSTVGPGQGTVSVHVDTHSGCTWTAQSQVDWIKVTSGTPGSGPGTVALSVAANTGSARTGNVTIAGQTVSVVQSEATPPPPPTCSFTIAPQSAPVEAAGGSGSFSLTASASSCTWTAASDASWIAITSAASGSGNATIAWSASANTGAARSGTISVAGQTFTVSQAAATPCTFVLNPASLRVGASGGPGSFSVATGASCSWAASASDSWISISAGVAGTGPGSVTFTVAANSGGGRTGTITVGGQPFTITQDGAPPPACVFVVTPTEASFGDNGGQGTVAIVTAPTCSWTASSQADWIDLTSPAAGSGPAAVSYRVSRFGGNSRQGTLTVAGQTVTITQQKKP